MAHLFIQDLTVIDCSLLDPTRGLIGESWSVDIELFGELDKQSMVLDFGKVKKTVKSIIDSQVDHKLLVPTHYKGTTIKQTNTTTQLTFKTQQQHTIKHTSPSEALCAINCESINAEQLTKHLHQQIKSALPSNVIEVNITLRQEQDYGFYYHYSHGLKKHDGNCQRIAHGHRSRIHVWQNGHRSRTFEQQISELFKDIYLGSQEDIVAQNEQTTHFAYHSPQGEFSLELPSNTVHILPTDTTVECIADYLAKHISQQAPNSEIKIQAFEGIKKGAIAIHTAI